MTKNPGGFGKPKRLEALKLLAFRLAFLMKIWYNFHSKSKGENTLSTDTVTISREEYESLLKANTELAQQVKDLSEAIALLRKQRFVQRKKQGG